MQKKAPRKKSRVKVDEEGGEINTKTSPVKEQNNSEIDLKVILREKLQSMQHERRNKLMQKNKI